MKQNKREELDLNNNKQHGNKKVHEHDQDQLEIHKAVAQAWHSHFNNAKEATAEFDVRKMNFKSQPSRFKLEIEALNKVNEELEAQKTLWNFNHSLWDPFEIVAVSKRLETGLVLHYDFDDLQNINEHLRVFKRRKESKNSLRNLFNMMSSRKIK